MSTLLLSDVLFPSCIDSSAISNYDLSSTTPGWSVMASPSARGSVPSSGALPSPSLVWAAWWAPSAWASWRTGLAGRNYIDEKLNLFLSVMCMYSVEMSILRLHSQAPTVIFYLDIFTYSHIQYQIVLCFESFAFP